MENTKENKPLQKLFIPFKDIPNDFQINSILNNRMKDITYQGIMRQLKDYDENFNQLYKRAKDNIGIQMLSISALNYLLSAISLYEHVLEDRKEMKFTNYLIPCLFCCRHSIELKLKECLCMLTDERPKNHNILELWLKLTRIINNKVVLIFDSFIKEINEMDENELVMRYGVNKDLEIMNERYLIDIDALIQNTKYLFNIFSTELSCV